MDRKKLHTVHDFELIDGSKVKMCLAFFLLLQLKTKNKSVYERYNKIMTKGPEEEMHNVVILYTAYLCANLQNIEECMDEMTFIEMLPDDRKPIMETVEALIYPKKK